ncbi:MAG: TetR/AcrR family transcriptional regulator [Sandaracinaceae bacterium]
MTKKPQREAARPRDAARTREAILESARRAFASSGYDGAGVREIAAGAGVTAMLINRYFGSKEELFAAVVADTMTRPVILTPEHLGAEDPSGAMASALVGLTEPDATPLDGFLMMMRSAASDRAAAIGRREIEAHYQARLKRALPGQDAGVRAAVVISLVAGLQLMRQGIGLPALADADPAALERVLERALRGLIEPPPDPPPPRRSKKKTKPD